MRTIVTFFAFFLLANAASVLTYAEEPLPRPTYKAAIEFYDPKDEDSSKGWPTLSFDQTDGHTYRKDGITFSEPAEELIWVFLKHEGNADVYEFTRRYLSDGAENRAEHQIVKFSGARIVVFQGRGQTVAIRSPQFEGEPGDSDDTTLTDAATIVPGLAAELPKMVGKSPEQLLKDHGPILQALTGAATNDPFATTPRYVWSYLTPRKDTNYVVFSERNMEMQPGDSPASVVLVSSAGKELDRWVFSTGWRSKLGSAELAYNNTVQAPVITIHTAPVINGRGIANQYFAFVDDKLYFIRMEDSEGRLLRNEYLSPNHTLGFYPPAKTVRDWMSLLESEQVALRLTALTYLAGVHMDPDNPRYELYSENINAAKVAHEFSMAPGTKSRIAEYRHSAIPWLAEAAELAATPPESH